MHHRRPLPRPKKARDQQFVSAISLVCVFTCSVLNICNPAVQQRWARDILLSDVEGAVIVVIHRHTSTLHNSILILQAHTTFAGGGDAAQCWPRDFGVGSCCGVAPRHFFSFMWDRVKSVRRRGQWTGKSWRGKKQTLKQYQRAPQVRQLQVCAMSKLVF